MDPISSLSALYKIRKISLKLLWGLNEIKYLITIQFLRYSSHFTYKSIHSYKLQFFSAIIIITPKLSSVTQSCLTLCDPIGCQTFLSTTNSEFTQTHVHCVGDTIQPSHPLSSPSPPTFNLSQHQGLFQWVSSLHQMAKVLEF